jgi:hypothetical protein
VNKRELLRIVVQLEERIVLIGSAGDGADAATIEHVALADFLAQLVLERSPISERDPRL